MNSVSLTDITAGRKPMFVTRWWDFRPSRWATVAFSSEGIVDRWIDQLPDGGFCLGFASHHKQEQIAQANQGRVFGVYQFVPEKTVYQDPKIVHPSYLEEPALRRANGEFRWPYGLRAVRAWEFNGRVMTGGTLPIARSLTYEATTNMVAISTADFAQANQHLLHEVEVFNIAFQPLQLREANAKPDGNYLLVCDDPKVLARLPGWRFGEVLIKPGIASNFEGRCEFLNNHALARIFGLTLRPYWQDPARSPEAAHAREQDMIEGAKKLGCRLVGQGQEEFLFANPRHLDSITAIGRPKN